MTPRGFEKFMVLNDNGRSKKLARLTDGEFRALVQGVWPIASEASPRGAFMVGKLPATAEDINFTAPKVSVKVAQAAIDKLCALGMLEFDDELGAWWVHDWHEVNPSPKTDTTSAARSKNYRERKRAAAVTAKVTPASRQSHAEGTPPEVEGEVEQPPLPPDGGTLQIPVRPSGKRQRELDAYEAELDQFVADLVEQRYCGIDRATDHVRHGLMMGCDTLEMFDVFVAKEGIGLRDPLTVEQRELLFRIRAQTLGAQVVEINQRGEAARAASEATA